MPPMLMTAMPMKPLAPPAEEFGLRTLKSQMSGNANATTLVKALIATATLLKRTARLMEEVGPSKSKLTENPKEIALALLTTKKLTTKLQNPPKLQKSLKPLKSQA